MLLSLHGMGSWYLEILQQVYNSKVPFYVEVRSHKMGKKLLLFIVINFIHTSEHPFEVYIDIQVRGLINCNHTTIHTGEKPYKPVQ